MDSNVGLTQKKQLQAQRAIEFLDQHPALATSVHPLLGALWFSIQEVCKNGMNIWAKKKGVDIWIGSKRAKLFKKELDKKVEELRKSVFESKDDSTLAERKRSFNLEKGLVRVEVPYEKVYGEPWKFDHVEYWGELGFYVFGGYDKKAKAYVNGKEEKFNPKKFAQVHEPRNWSGYSGLNVSGRTFEEMMIKLAQGAKRDWGNFNMESFLTEREKANHKKERSCFFRKLKKDSRYSKMLHNPKYIEVTDAEINLRWYKWFRGTSTWKKDWGRSAGK